MFKDLRKKFGKKMKVLNTIELSFDAFKSNYDYYDKKHPEAKICPVLKSNAYGHGLIQMAKMCDKLSPPYIVVDSFYEAFEIQNSGVKTPCLIIGYTLPENFKNMSFKNVAVTILDLDSIKALGELNKSIKIHLKVDTGMHREGVPMSKVDEALRLINSFPKLELEGILSHLADADNSDQTYTKEQITEFEEAIKKVDVKWKHLSATAGAGVINNKDFNLIRLGLGLYGDSPIEEDAENLKPVMKFNSTLIDIKNLKKGESVSYGCKFTAEKDMKIGVIPAGYYEGVDRRLSNKGFVYYDDVACQILGTVCMNLTVFDLSEVENPEKWYPVEVIGRKKSSARWIAEACDTISYVILTHIAPSIRRKPCL